MSIQTDSKTFMSNFRDFTIETHGTAKTDAREQTNSDAISPLYYIPYPSPRRTLRQRGHLA